jgi:hypothetical protein
MRIEVAAMTKRRVFRCFVLLSLMTTIPTAVPADEGMWTFNNVPREAIKKRYGFEVTDAWLRRVQLASVRFNSGGSGSFVSPTGLVLTNHHIASDTLGKISTPEHDYFATGFYAPTRDQEVKSPDLELNVLVSIEDVTPRITGAVTSSNPAEANAQRRAVIAEVEKESLAATGLRSDVVTLYKGAQFHVYRYKKYTDVRLVFAPEQSVAFFGGDPANFEYPRFNLDMAVFRVYEDGKPIRSDNFLPWSKTGVSEGDLVFVSGSPGSTSRLNTVAHLVFQREVQYPFNIGGYERLESMLLDYGRRGAEQARQAHDELFSVQNRLKVWRGEFRGLNDATLMSGKEKAEENLRRTVAGTPRLKEAYGDPWSDVTTARERFRAYYRDYRLLESGWGFDSSLFKIARDVVRLTAENEKPNSARFREYSDAGRASLELALYSPAPIYDEFETARLTSSLQFLRDQLGPTHAIVQTALAGKSPDARAAELVSGTRLKDVATRKALVAGGSKAVAESSDPMIGLARSIDAAARELRKSYEEQVETVEERAYGKIARILYDIEGAGRYPDATFTPRIAFGAVRGYKEGAKDVAWNTTFAGMYAASSAAGNREPLALPDRWIAKRAGVKLDTPINFVSTADTIGGNSGSPLVNRSGELVGLNFDRNSHGLVRNFVYDDLRARNVAVDARGMLEALRHIYDAGALADELLRGK